MMYMRVLYIDDDEELISAAEKYLSDAGGHQYPGKVL